MKKKADRFLELFAPHKRKLWRFCLSISRTRENAQDLLQDTIEVAFQKYEQLVSPEAFLSYLFTIASRLNYRMLEQAKAYCPISEDLIESLISSEASPEDRIDIQIMYQCLDTMKYEYKEAIVLIELMGLSHSDAADIQGITIDAIRKRLYRGKEMLRELMNPKPQEIIKNNKE